MLQLVSLLVVYLPAPIEFKVFIGPDATQAVRIESAEIGYPIDIAFDQQTKSLFVLGIAGTSLYVRSWGSDGAPRGNWQIPRELDATSVLHSYRGSISAVMWNREKKKVVLAS